MDLWGFFVGFFAIGAIIVLLALYVAARIFNFLSPVLSAVLLTGLFLLLVVFNLALLGSAGKRLRDAFPILSRRFYRWWATAFEVFLETSTVWFPAVAFFLIARYNSGALHSEGMRQFVYQWVDGPGRPQLPINLKLFWYTLLGNEMDLVVLFLARWVVVWLVTLGVRAVRKGWAGDELR